MKLEKISKIYNSHNLDFQKENTILVAGTNGKGTTVKYLEEVFSKIGYKVGTFTSPHIYSEYERIRINGKNILKEDFDKIYEEFSDYDLTFFEKYFLIACKYFKNENVDIRIMETGIGGLYDTVNVCLAKYAIITSISYDHIDILGETLEEISYQKAGICKDNKICIFNEEKYLLPENVRKFTKNDIYIDYKESIELSKKLNLKYEYQIRNFSNVRKLLNLYKIEDDIIVKLLKDVKEKFRQEEINYNGYNLIVDVAHNEDSFDKLIDFINDKYKEYKKVYIISMLENKDLKTVYKKLLKNSDKIYVFEMPDKYHGRTRKNISETIEIKESEILNIEKELNIELEKIMIEKEKTVYILCGSFYFVSQFKE